ncbi:MAG: hypothetical protein JWL71_3568 [Acidobacteria bacterium]|nr:hypothetical protein [Acidobacteriota bacterium]
MLVAVRYARRAGHGALLVAVMASACALADAAEPRWTAVRSGSMTVLGDQPANALRDIAQELEQFRAVLGRLSASGRPAATAPTLVYVFGSRKTFEQFVPLRNGRPLSVGGYFQRGVDTNTIALSTEGFAGSAPIVFHEYTHLLLGSALRAVPVWLNEGLAEYYSTYRLRSGGKGADIGLAIAPHVALLRQRFLPLAQLLTVDHASDLYNEGERRSIFYAESWALTHYLMTELPSGPMLINQFAGAIAGGTNPEAAFAATFGRTPAAFEPQLRAYLRGLTFKSWIYTFNERLQADAPAPARVVSPAEAQAWLGDLQLRINRTSEAARRIEAAVAAEPGAAAVQLTLARLRLAEARTPDADAALARAVRAAPDDFDIQYGAGVTMLQSADVTTGDERGEVIQRASDALTRATTIDAQSPDAFGWLAYAGLLQRNWNDAGRAIALAVMLAPGRTDFRLRQADIMILRGAPNAARPMLQDIAAHAIDPVAVDGARRRLDALEAAGVRGSATYATARAAIDEPRGPLPRMRLELRPVQAGEDRAFGHLTTVECAGGEVRFHVTAGDRDIVTAAARFADVDLIVYGEPREGMLACGARVPADAVYVTWRIEKPAAWPSSMAGVAVAVEFLPSGFRPN